MNNKLLYNQKNKKELLDNIKNEEFNRITLSFYKYVNLNNLNELRDELYLELSKLNVLGRIYISKEGINAQISIPKHNLKLFKKKLNQNSNFKDMPFKIAIEENASFYKLIIKVKKEIVLKGISIIKYGQNEYPITHQIIKDGEKNKVLSKKIKSLICVSMFHVKKDDIVPTSFSKKVLSIFVGAKKKLIIIKDGDHSLSNKNHLKRITKELDKIVSNIL